jgi:hypothetical protein
MVGVGAGAASTCIVGAEVTTYARVVHAGSLGGMGITGRIHGPAREGARTGDQRLRVGPTARERMGCAHEEKGRRPDGPTG